MIVKFRLKTFYLKFIPMNSIKIILLAMVCFLMTTCFSKDEDEESEPKLGKQFKVRYEATLQDSSKFFMKIDYDDVDVKDYHDIKTINTTANGSWKRDLNGYYGYSTMIRATKKSINNQMNDLELMNDPTHITVKIFLNDILVSSQTGTEDAVCYYVIGQGGE